MAFSADGKLLACGGITEVSNAFAGIGNPLVVVFDFENGREEAAARHRARSSRRRPRSVRFHRDGFVIGSTGGIDGGHLLFWKLDQPNEFFDFKLPDSAATSTCTPTSCAWSPRTRTSRCACGR